MNMDRVDKTRGHTIPPRRWLNRTVLGIGAASFFSDVAHETATALLPILAGGTMAPAAILGAVEGISDAASGAAKLGAGVWTDRLLRLKPLAVGGYLVSAVAGASLGAASHAWQIIAARAVAWTGRGVRTPARGALLAGGVPAAHFGKAFGLERGMDTLGAVVGPLLAAALIPFLPVHTLLWWTLLPGLAARGVDWQAAVVTTDMSDPQRRGRMLPFATGGVVLGAATQVLGFGLGAQPGVVVFGRQEFGGTQQILDARHDLGLLCGLGGGNVAALDAGRG